MKERLGIKYKIEAKKVYIKNWKPMMVANLVDIFVRRKYWVKVYRYLKWYYLLIRNLWKSPTNYVSRTIDYRPYTVKPKKYKQRREYTGLSTLQKIYNMQKMKHINRKSTRHENDAEVK